METVSPEVAPTENSQRLAADIGKKWVEYMAQIQRLVSAEAAEHQCRNTTLEVRQSH